MRSYCDDHTKRTVGCKPCRLADTKYRIWLHAGGGKPERTDAEEADIAALVDVLRPMSEAETAVFCAGLRWSGRTKKEFPL